MNGTVTPAPSAGCSGAGAAGHRRHLTSGRTEVRGNSDHLGRRISNGLPTAAAASTAVLGAFYEGGLLRTFQPTEMGVRGKELGDAPLAPREGSPHPGFIEVSG